MLAQSGGVLRSLKPPGLCFVSLFFACSLLRIRMAPTRISFLFFDARAWPPQVCTHALTKHVDDICPAPATAFASRQEKVVEACDRVLALAPTNKKAAIRRQRAVRRMV